MLKIFFLFFLLLPLTLWGADGHVSIETQTKDSWRPFQYLIPMLNDYLEDRANQKLPGVTAQEYAEGIYSSQLVATTVIDGSSYRHSQIYELSFNSSLGWRGGSLGEVIDQPSSIKGVGASSSIDFSIRGESLFGYRFRRFNFRAGLIIVHPPDFGLSLSGEMSTYQLMVDYHFLKRSDLFWDGIIFSTGFQCQIWKSGQCRSAAHPSIVYFYQRYEYA